MDLDDATAFISTAVSPHRGSWAELGAGEGTFTRALARLLEPGSRIFAVDRDRDAVAALERLASRETVSVIPVAGDFALPLALPGVAEGELDGLLLANALHFVRRAESVLGRLTRWLRPGGRVVLIEYDRRSASRWVPYPIPAARLPDLAASAGLSTPTITATRPSTFGGVLYVAAAERW